MDYFKAFKNFHGFYFEPMGEPESMAVRRKAQTRGLRPKGLKRLIERLFAQHSEFEVAIAIGRFNNAEYLRQMAQLGPKRVYWWWCWGDSLKDKALELFPNVLTWHTTSPGEISQTHSTRQPPGPSERKLL